MLDDNLPTFFLKPAGKVRETAHQQPIYFSHLGSDPLPTYTLHHADPSLPTTQRNVYAAGLFDSYNPEVLYGEVLARPAWSQPTLSAEEIRRNQNNGFQAQPPQPVLPPEFDVQLYDPDQQVRVAVKEGKWGGSDSYEFSMPETSFRAPSASTLDQGQSDPAALDITPKLNFVWRRESKLSKDLTCYMTGRSTDTVVKKKSKRDPDIAVALWRSLRELTVYEPNLQRMEIEDPKGFEVVLLLSAVVIKDLYMNKQENLRQAFNISNDAAPKLSAGGRKISNPPAPMPVAMSGALVTGPSSSRPMPSNQQSKRNSLPRLQTTPPAQPPSQHRPHQQQQQLPGPQHPPILDPETARLKAAADAEAATQRRQRRDREKAEEAETKRLRKMVEDEARDARKKQEALDRETERLRRQYGVQPVPQRPQQQQNVGRQRPPGRHSGGSGGGGLQPIPQGRPVRSSADHGRMGSNGLYLQPNAGASSSMAVMSGANGVGGGEGQLLGARKKKSFWGLRGGSEDAGDGGGAGGSRLKKKGSAMW